MSAEDCQEEYETQSIYGVREPCCRAPKRARKYRLSVVVFEAHNAYWNSSVEARIKSAYRDFRLTFHVTSINTEGRYPEDDLWSAQAMLALLKAAAWLPHSEAPQFPSSATSRPTASTPEIQKVKLLLKEKGPNNFPLDRLFLDNAPFGLIFLC